MSQKKPYVRIAGCALLLSIASRGSAQVTAVGEMEFARFLVGSWSCADTVGSYHGTYETTIAPALGNRWLRQTYSFPASPELPNGLGGEYFIGFDPRVQKWIRQGAMTDGMYFAMVGRRSGDTLSYGYVLPGTSGTAIYVKRSDREYSVEGPSYPENGTMVTEHHTCRKRS